MLHRVIEAYKDRVAASATGLFKHAKYPLAHTLTYRGDPGLFGPDSVTWPVLGDAAAFVGGLRALLVQAAHPEVAAGVADHSRYREDPLGRLSRTSNYVTATCFGAAPEVEEAVAVVRRIHRRVQGTSHRGIGYAADLPPLAAWVHNALTDSFLVAHQCFGPAKLSPGDADRFVAEQAKIGRLLDADPTPETSDGLAEWIEDHAEAGDSPALREAIGFLRKPPLAWTIRTGYKVLFAAAAATIPRRLRRMLGLRRRPGAILLGKAAIGFLRWALGSSPSWHLALLRVDAPIPEGLFRQPLPPEAVETA